MAARDFLFYVQKWLRTQDQLPTRKQLAEAFPTVSKKILRKALQSEIAKSSAPPPEEDDQDEADE